MFYTSSQGHANLSTITLCLPIHSTTGKPVRSLRARGKEDPVKVEKKAEAPKDPLVLNYTLNESEIKSDINDIADDWINQSSKFRSKLAPAKVKADRGVLSVGDVNFEKGAAVIVTSSVTKSDFFGRLPSFTVLFRLRPCISLYTFCI